MGLKPDVLITDTNRADLPASVEADKDSRVVPQSVSSSGKRKYRSLLAAALQSPVSATSSVVGVHSVTRDKEVTASSQATAAVKVVASMHSYAMPSSVHRPTKLTAEHTAIESASSAEDHRASNDETDSGNSVKRPVSPCRLNV